MTKKTCIVCGAEVVTTNNGKPRCPNWDCCLGWAVVAIWERLETRGDCLVYEPTMNRKGDVAYISLQMRKEDGSLFRRDLRVIDLIAMSWGIPFPPRSHMYERLCDTEWCANPDHHRLRVAESTSGRGPALTITAHLPFEPLEKAIEWWRRVHSQDGLHTRSMEFRAIPKRFQTALSRARRDGYITVSAADEICCDLLEIHPVLIYGDLFYEAA